MNKQELIKSYEDGRFGMILVDRVLEDLRQLDEPQKVTVPQFVTNWIDYCKKHNFTLFRCLDPVNGFESLADEIFEGDIIKCIRWCRKESDKFARAWLFGYTVKKEKQYIVKVKDNGQYLGRYYINDEVLIPQFIRTQLTGRGELPTFTRKELEDAGFGEVFNSTLFEVEEVE